MDPNLLYWKSQGQVGELQSTGEEDLIYHI